MFEVVGNYLPAVFVPCSLDLLEFVGVYPGFKNFFILPIDWVSLLHIFYWNESRWFLFFDPLHVRRAYEQVVWEDCNVFVIIFPLIIVWTTRQRVCASIGRSFDMVNFDVVFGELEYFPCDAMTYLLWVSPILQIHVVRKDL